MPRSTTCVPGPPRPWWPVVAVLVAAVFAGCASPLAPAPSGVAPPPPGTVDGRFPVTVVHTMGETVVPAAPQRIVALGMTDLDVLLALGIRPVAMGATGAELPSWVTARLGGPPPRPVVTVPDQRGFAYYDEPYFDGTRVGLRDVDLISAASSALSREEYDGVREIAPTITSATPDGGTWQDTTRLVGQAVGRPVAAERLVTDVENRIAAAPSRYPELAGRSAVCVAYQAAKSGNGPFHLDRDCTDMLAWLGMRRVPEIEAASPDAARPYPFAPAEIAAARPDLVVLSGLAGGDAAPEMFPRDLRLVDLDEADATALQYPSVLGIPVVLDSLPPKLVRALR